MPDNCNPNDCAVGVRVTVLEKEFDRYRTNSSDTHRQMLGRIGSLEQDRASLKTKLDDIDTKLDGLASTVSALAEKPGRRWDSLVDKLIYAAALAVVAWVAAGAPGLK